MPQDAHFSVVFRTALVRLFEIARRRRRRERLAAVTGPGLFDGTPRTALSLGERANRLYAMGELAAAAALLQQREKTGGPIASRRALDPLSAI
jgi:hypothetical protein